MTFVNERGMDMLNSNRDLFQKKKIIRFKTLLQNIWIAIVGIILGLPAGFYFTDYIFKYSIGDNYDFFATVDISTYLIAIGFMFGVTLLTNWILGRKIKTIDMVTALKANE